MLRAASRRVAVTATATAAIIERAPAHRRVVAIVTSGLLPGGPRERCPHPGTSTHVGSCPTNSSGRRPGGTRACRLRSLAADQRYAPRHVDLETVGRLEDVPIQHQVRRTREADGELLADAVVEQRLAGGEAAVDPHRPANQAPRRDRSAEDVEVAA